MRFKTSSSCLRALCLAAFFGYRTKQLRGTGLIFGGFFGGYLNAEETANKTQNKNKAHDFRIHDCFLSKYFTTPYYSEQLFCAASGSSSKQK
jgi:hypothetical protein